MQLRCFSSATRVRYIAAAALLSLLAGCSSDPVHLQPGATYSVKSGSGPVICPGKWSDYERIVVVLGSPDKDDHNAALMATISDGGTILIDGDHFTVLGFGSGGEEPVRIRSSVNGKLCWLPDWVIQGIIAS